jgi:hypothetical protein
VEVNYAGTQKHELIAKFRTGETITKLDKDNGIELQTISDMKDNNKPKFMK